MGGTGHSSLQSMRREWRDCKHRLPLLVSSLPPSPSPSLSLSLPRCALFLPRRCLDIISFCCSELWLWARSRMWHFNTFPLWSTGTGLLPVKQVEGGNRELPPQSWAKSTFSTQPNCFPVGLGEFQLAGVIPICYRLLFNIKSCQGSCNSRSDYEVVV